MLTDNIKTYNDEEVINLINKIVMGEVDAELSELKMILAEASGRKLEKSYINIIAERIKEKIQPEKAEPRRKTETHEKKEKTVETVPHKITFDDVYNYTDEDDYDDEDEDELYPVLSFLCGLYKVFAWIVFAGIIVTGVVVSMLLFNNNMLLVCATMFGSILLSIIFLLMFLGWAEKIKLKLDIERHLREIISK